MTIEEQLAYLDHLEGRVLALRTQARAFAARRYEPQFVLVPHPNVWGPPHPYDDYPPPDEWNTVIAASVAAGVSIACVATVLALVKP